MEWTKQQLDQHKKAAKQLSDIMAESFAFISKNSSNISEYDVQQFILQEFRKRNLKTDKDKTPIVAFGINTSFVHYFPEKDTALKLEPNCPVMIDIWARVNEPKSPFADITWVGYFGKAIPVDFEETYTQVKLARDEAVAYIEKKLETKIIPTGGEVDSIAREFFDKTSRLGDFLHRTGHCIGFASAHGKTGGNLKLPNRNPLMKNIGYTIEPGLYYPGRFGARSEINFYINDDFELIITTEVQKAIIAL